MHWLAALLGLVIACGSTQGTAPVARPAGPLLALERARDLDGVVVGPSSARATLVVALASWCTHCKTELAVIDSLRAAHPHVRILGVSYRGHEEYAGRGSSEALRSYLAASAPWLRVVLADDALFTALGRPAKVPALVVYDAGGALVARYDRRERAMPDAAELAALFAAMKH